MRTTVTLNQDLVEAVKDVTGESTKTRAVVSALREHVRRKKLAELRALLGKVGVDEDAVAEMERLEMRRPSGRRSSRSCGS